MFMEIRPDHCKTAQDVRIAASRVFRLRQTKPVEKLLIKISSREAELEAIIIALRQELCAANGKLALAESTILQIRPISSQPVHRIIDLVSMGEQVPRAEILSHRRNKQIWAARSLVYYLAGTTTSMSLPAIGRLLNRDHSSVLHGKQKMARLRSIDPVLDGKLKFYEAKLLEHPAV